MIKTVLQGLLVIFFFVTVKVGQQVSPAIGDVRLERLPRSPFYEVLIFYTDGVNPPHWGGICADISPEASNVLCRQLGFTASGILQSGDESSAYPIWLKSNIECTGDETHILQCGYDEVTGSERSGPMACENTQGRRQQIWCQGLQQRKRPTAYDGEIRLCPPDSTLNNPNNDNITSVSFGVVALNIGGQWRGIIQASGGGGELLGSDEADAICRQLGFTDAVVGSAVARSSTSYSSDFTANCYSKAGGSQNYTIQVQAWMTTEDVKCNSPQNCLGCCYSVPPETGCQNCDAQQDIVIGCTFDINKSKNPKITGSQDKCTLNSKQCLEAECSSERKDLRNLRGALGFFFALSVVINIIVVIICIVRQCRRT